jgi:hypothetical protein
VVPPRSRRPAQSQLGGHGKTLRFGTDGQEGPELTVPVSLPSAHRSPSAGQTFPKPLMPTGLQRVAGIIHRVHSRRSGHTGTLLQRSALTPVFSWLFSTHSYQCLNIQKTLFMIFHRLPQVQERCAPVFPHPHSSVPHHHQQQAVHTRTVCWCVLCDVKSAQVGGLVRAH